jgi:hypothetical protein
MGISVFPDSTNISLGYSLSSGAVSTYSFSTYYSVGSAAEGFATINAYVPQGIYETFSTATSNFTIYVPSSSGDSAASGRGNNGIAYPAVLKVTTSSTQYQIRYPQSWPSAQVTLGTAMYQRFVVGGNNTAVTLLTLSTASTAYRIYTSTNGSTWTEQTTPGGSVNSGGDGRLGGNYYPAAYGNGWFGIGTDIDSCALFSTSGVTWTTRNTNQTGNLCASINFANGFFFANSKTDTFSISTDTINWTTRSQGVASQTYATAYSPVSSIYVRGGNGPFIVTSTNLTTWTTRAIPGADTQAIRSVSFGDGYFIASGISNSALNTNFFVSTSGITWTTAPSGQGITGNPNNIIYTTAHNVHISGLKAASTNSLYVIGTSSGAGYGTTNIVITTCSSVTYSGNMYFASAINDSGGSTNFTIAYSTTPVGRSSGSVQGYFTLRSYSNFTSL